MIYEKILSEAARFFHATIGYLIPLEYINQWKQQVGCLRDVLN